MPFEMPAVAAIWGTDDLDPITPEEEAIREQDPLKQGLKLKLEQ